MAAGSDIVSYKPRILIIDDNLRDLAPTIAALKADYQVYESSSGSHGQRMAADHRPEVILLDYLMPDKNGAEVCKELRANPSTRDLPIVMFSVSDQREHTQQALGCADDFIPKSSITDIQLFKWKIDAAIRKFRPFPDEPLRRTRLSIFCQSGEPIAVRESGQLVYTGHAPLDISERLHRQVAFMPPQVLSYLYPSLTVLSASEWADVIKESGFDQYEKLFRRHPDVVAAYEQARTREGQDANLHLRLESRRASLSTPLEFLFAGNSAIDGEFLSLRHPFARSIIRDGSAVPVISRLVMNRYCAERRALRILLLASNTPPGIPGADREISELERMIRPAFEGRGIRTEITTLRTEQATLGRVLELLRSAPAFDMIHYAGHATYDRTVPSNSALYFWNDENKSGGVATLTCHTLCDHLEENPPRFVYLSCCWAAAWAPADSAMYDDYSGIADALIGCRVPAVLGHRWPVMDDGALILAQEFYRSLATNGELDSALRIARKALRNRAQGDPGWISPVLILQD